MSKKGFILIFGLVLLLLVSILGQGREPITIGEIDMSGIKLPDRVEFVSDKELVTREENWMYRTQSIGHVRRMVNDLFLRVPPERGRIDSWISSEHSYYVEFAIIEYTNPLLAWLEFRFDDPQSRYRSFFWNFTYEKENIIPSDWVPLAGPDEELAKCGEGNSEGCVFWFYTARYGQYYLSIDLRNSADAETFRDIVKSIIEELNSYLN